MKRYATGSVMLLIVILAVVGCARRPMGRLEAEQPELGLAQAPWRGVHFLWPGKDGLPLLKQAIVEELAPRGMNVLILEVGYGYEYQSHPELRDENALSREDIRSLVEVCRRHHIRVIPLFNCLGHQSWAENTFPLLTQYPEFDETPEIPLHNPDIYCRSWCPLHPDVNRVIFALMDELIDAFDADAFHVGMDEVFLIASDQCSRCRGKDPAELFAKAVNDYHDYLVKERGLTMLLWGDRLLDAHAMRYSEWEASTNGTAPAIDLIPRDIIVCDWHYGLGEKYPSVDFFQEKGFRVLPTSWKDEKAAVALLQYSFQNESDLMLGHLCTTWYNAGQVSRVILGELSKGEVAEGPWQAAQTVKVILPQIAPAR